MAPIWHIVVSASLQVLSVFLLKDLHVPRPTTSRPSTTLALS
jgi:hypothetical protein